MRATRGEARPPLSLTDRGRIHAVLLALDARWESLHPWERARARHLLEELRRCYRSGEVRRPE